MSCCLPQGAAGSNSCIKSSEPVKSLPAVIANGGSGANQASGVTSSDKGGTVLVGVGCGNGGGGVLVDNDSGTDVTLGVLAGALQEEVTSMMMRKIGWIFINAPFSINASTLTDFNPAPAQPPTTLHPGDTLQAQRPLIPSHTPIPRPYLT